MGDRGTAGLRLPSVSIKWFKKLTILCSFNQPSVAFFKLFPFEICAYLLWPEKPAHPNPQRKCKAHSLWFKNEWMNELKRKSIGIRGNMSSRDHLTSRNRSCTWKQSVSCCFLLSIKLTAPQQTSNLDGVISTNGVWMWSAASWESMDGVRAHARAYWNNLRSDVMMLDKL